MTLEEAHGYAEQQGEAIVTGTDGTTWYRARREGGRIRFWAWRSTWQASFWHEVFCTPPASVNWSPGEAGRAGVPEWTRPAPPCDAAGVAM